jgi:hypothetical protein
MFRGGLLSGSYLSETFLHRWCPRDILIMTGNTRAESDKSRLVWESTIMRHCVVDIIRNPNKLSRNMALQQGVSDSDDAQDEKV